MKQNNGTLSLKAEFNGIKDSILNAFADRDFDLVMRLANLLEAKNSSANDFGGDSSENCGGDFGEDFIVAGCEQLGEFVSSAIALSALEVAKATQAKRNSHISKQAIAYAKIAQRAHKASQNQISQNQNECNDSLQSKISQNDSPQSKSVQSAQNKILCDEISQDKMAFYDLTLAKAYASNGDIEQSKEMLQNLAKPFLDFALQSVKSSDKSSAMDSSLADFSEHRLDSHIDKNIAGGGR